MYSVEIIAKLNDKSFNIGFFNAKNTLLMNVKKCFNY